MRRACSSHASVTARRKSTKQAAEWRTENAASECAKEKSRALPPPHHPTTSNHNNNPAAKGMVALTIGSGHDDDGTFSTCRGVHGGTHSDTRPTIQAIAVIRGRTVGGVCARTRVRITNPKPRTTRTPHSPRAHSPRAPLASRPAGMVTVSGCCCWPGMAGFTGGRGIVISEYLCPSSTHTTTLEVTEGHAPANR
jgi:hypothetical protein